MLHCALFSLQFPWCLECFLNYKVMKHSLTILLSLPWTYTQIWFHTPIPQKKQRFIVACVGYHKSIRAIFSDRFPTVTPPATMGRLSSCFLNAHFNKTRSSAANEERVRESFQQLIICNIISLLDVDSPQGSSWTAEGIITSNSERELNERVD